VFVQELVLLGRVLVELVPAQLLMLVTLLLLVDANLSNTDSLLGLPVGTAPPMKASPKSRTSFCS
jgi:hypothetical protein